MYSRTRLCIQCDRSVGSGPLGAGALSYAMGKKRDRGVKRGDIGDMIKAMSPENKERPKEAELTCVMKDLIEDDGKRKAMYAKLGRHLYDKDGNFKKQVPAAVVSSFTMEKDDETNSSSPSCLSSRWVPPSAP